MSGYTRNRGRTGNKAAEQRWVLTIDTLKTELNQNRDFYSGYTSKLPQQFLELQIPRPHLRRLLS